MNRRDLEGPEGLFVSRTAAPPTSRTSRRAPHELVLGFDTEYVAAERRLLSVQLAAQTENGLVSAVLEPPGLLLTPLSLLLMVVDFVKQHGLVVRAVRGLRRVSLVAHFAVAEIGMFENPLRDLDILQVNKTHHAVLPKMSVDGAEWQIEIVDLFGYFQMSLAKVGQSIGLLKLDVDPTQLEHLKLHDRAAFDAYASRDAEIAVEAHRRFRKQNLDRWGVDVLAWPTLASIAGEIFRRHFFFNAPAPFKMVVEPVRRKRADGTWSTSTRRAVQFAGNVDVRRAALRAYHGARSEAFVTGLLVEPVVERDVAAMYPSAAMSQPLPCAKSRWYPVRSPRDVERMEGFGSFRFRFPRQARFPSLVVRGPDGRLFFPLSGTTHASFAEIRGALRLGAEVEPVDARGFVPGAQEADHDVKKYMQEFVAMKNAATKGTLEYEVAKLLMNALVGKLMQQLKTSWLLPLEQECRREGFNGFGAMFDAHPEYRRLLDATIEVGSLWAPEWGAMILAKARAWIGAVVARGVHLVSTDAVIAPAGFEVDAVTLGELQGVGSAMPIERSADAVFIVRAKLYALLKRVENIGRDDVVLGRDSTWAVLKVVRQGTAEKGGDLAETILRCLAARTNVAPPRQITKLLTAEGAVRAKGEVNAEVIVERTTRFRWDDKRRLVDRDVNIFSTSTTTEPYESVARLVAAARQREGGRPRRSVGKISDDKRAEVLRLLGEGHGVRETARLVGVSPSTVSSIRADQGGAHA